MTDTAGSPNLPSQPLPAGSSQQSSNSAGPVVRIPLSRQPQRPAVPRPPNHRRWVQAVVGFCVLVAVIGLVIALARGRSQPELPALTTYVVPAVPALTASAARPSTQPVTVRDVLRFEVGNWMTTATTAAGARVLLGSATPLAAGSTYEALQVDQVFVTTATPLRFATVSSMRGQTVLGDLQALTVLRVAPAYRPPERVVEAVVIPDAGRPATPAAEPELSYAEREQIRQQRVQDCQKAETERKRQAQEAEAARVHDLIQRQGRDIAVGLPDLTDRLTQVVQADGKVLDAMAVPRTFAGIQADLMREVTSIDAFWEDYPDQGGVARQLPTYAAYAEAKQVFTGLVAASQVKMQKWEAWAAKATNPEEKRRLERERRADVAALQRRRDLDAQRRRDLAYLDRRDYGSPKADSTTNTRAQVRLGERYAYDRRSRQWVVVTD